MKEKRLQMKKKRKKKLLEMKKKKGKKFERV